METPDDIAGYRMRLPPNTQNFFSTIRSLEYYKTFARNQEAWV